jgi:hypothetical protein
VVGRRWSLALVATGLVAATIFGTVFFSKRQEAGPPSAGAPSEPRPPAVTPSPPSVDPIGPGVAPPGPEGTTPAGMGAETRSDPASGKGKVKPRKRSGSTRGKNTSNRQKSDRPDRRPNPF